MIDISFPISIFCLIISMISIAISVFLYLRHKERDYINHHTFSNYELSDGEFMAKLRNNKGREYVMVCYIPECSSGET